MNEAPSKVGICVVVLMVRNYEFDREPTNVVRLIQVLGRNHSKRQLLYTIWRPVSSRTGIRSHAEGRLLDGLASRSPRPSHKVAQAYTYLIDFLGTK